MLPPFKDLKKQQLAGTIGLVIGSYLMIFNPSTIAGITLNWFIAGGLIFFMSFIYFSDMQKNG